MSCEWLLKRLCLMIDLSSVTLLKIYEYIIYVLRVGLSGF